MRTIVIVCSIISAAALVVLGGFLNFLGGFRIDFATPYDDPVRVVATFIGAAPGFGVALTGLGVALYDAARRGGVGWFIALLAWPFVPLLAASLMFLGVLAHPTDWYLAFAFVPLAPFVYVLVAPAPSPTSPASVVSVPASAQLTAASRSRLAAFVGVLAVVVVSGVVLLFPGPPSSAAPGGPPALQVTQTSAVADCASGSYPSITVTNSSAQIQQWTAKSQDPSVSAAPAGGSLAPGASVTVSLSGTTSATSVIVQFLDGNQTSVPAKFGCQAGAST
jgi:hypothetical protein